ncbi:uncharacterized protein LOC126811505, partial [Patella vulgata]|uniref:uncharacterized protein LOC126811505 n=1 Tax=Patella vulgata TaxID=6465 RepID=UPI0024A95178
KMDLIEMAKELQHLLMIHDKAVKHILDLDSKVCDMNQRTITLVDNEKTGQALQMMFRKTSVEGLREMYKQYRLKKWDEIQKLAKTFR